MDILNDAFELRNEIVEDRKILHKYAETGFDMPNTLSYVQKKLTDMGYKPTLTGKSGLSCIVGNGKGKTILLRCDMDALPMKEETLLPYSAENGNFHACGHDIHTAMLLGAAKILKKYEKDINGYAKLIFQPAEELLAGAVDMINAGVLQNPRVDAAFALHITAGTELSHSGTVYWNFGGITYSGDAIKIFIKGKHAHGSTPYLGVDAINIAAAIVQGLNSIVNKNIACSDEAVVLVGKISGGTAVNTVAGEAYMEVSVRAVSADTRALLKRKVKEIAENTAILYGGEATVEYWYGMPPLINDEKFSKEIMKYCVELLGNDKVQSMKKLNGSEDFCMFSEKVPAALFTVGVGGVSEGYCNALHHPAMMANDDSFYIGAAVYANSALQWLKNNR